MVDFDKIRSIMDKCRSGEALPMAEVEIMTCGNCGHELGLRRKSWGLDSQEFCNQACYRGYLRNPAYIESKKGMRAARALVGKHFALKAGHVVHHKDSDETNNSIGNLAVYASTSDHLKAHHGRVVATLWDGELIES